MNSREKIINKIKESLGERNIELDTFDYLFQTEDLLGKFKVSLISVAAFYGEVTDYSEISKTIIEHFPNIKSCVNTISEIEIESIDMTSINVSKDLHPLDLSIIKGKSGVAENGTIWVNVGDLPDRTIPFLCENLVVVIDKKNLVSNMHEAYETTDKLNYEYGVFITGPSKTADIEQTLVVGAQGPRKMLVLIKS